ncbi:unnamed protein product, partial [Ectocarpus sp. 12 AP-2014]
PHVSRTFLHFSPTPGIRWIITCSQSPGDDDNDHGTRCTQDPIFTGFPKTICACLEVSSQLQERCSCTVARLLLEDFPPSESRRFRDIHREGSMFSQPFPPCREPKFSTPPRAPPPLPGCLTFSA